MSIIDHGRSDGAAHGRPVAHDFDPFAGMPHEFFAAARRDSPVFYQEDIRGFVLTRYEDCRRLLGDRSGAVSANAALMQHLNVQPSPQATAILRESGFVPVPVLVDEDGEDHRLHRAATQPPFTQTRIKPLAGFIRRQVTERLDVIVADGAADLVAAMIYEVPATVILHMMGVPDEQLDMVRDFRGPWAVYTWGKPDQQVQLRTAEMMGAFGKWARGVMAERLAQPGADILSEAAANLRAKGAFERSRDFLDGYTLNIVMAGHETTANTAAYGLVHLLSDATQWQALVDEPALIPNAAEEILRYSTGVPTWRQRVLADMEFSGVTVPAGSVVYAAINSANRDEDVFGPDAERLNVRRESARRHIAFGTGAHTCMGNHLARLELCIMLEKLTRRLPHLELVPDQVFEFSPNTSQRGPERVLVRWNPRRNPLHRDRL
jgi:hypothetical protein